MNPIRRSLHARFAASILRDTGCTIQLDPADHYDHPAQDIIAACGLVLPWVISPGLRSKPLREALEHQYNCGPLLEIPGKAAITDSLLFTYPEDPDLYPLVSVERPLPQELEAAARGEAHMAETFVMYPHAIVAIGSPDGKWFISRMD